MQHVPHLVVQSGEVAASGRVPLSVECGFSFPRGLENVWNFMWTNVGKVCLTIQLNLCKSAMFLIVQ